MITVRTINGVYCLRTCGFDGKNMKIRRAICRWFVINCLFDAYTGKQQTTMVFVCAFSTKMERFDSRKNWGSLGILQFHFAHRLQI